HNGIRYVYGEVVRGWRSAIEAKYPGLSLSDWKLDQVIHDPAEQGHLFRQAVGELLDQLANQPGRPGLLLCLDEIDAILDEPGYLRFSALLRSIAENPRWRGRFALLVASVDSITNRRDWSGEQRNPFFAFFSELPLAPLEPEDTRKMILTIGGLMGVEYTEDALELLVDIGGGHPFLTRQLCSQAARNLERPIKI